MLKDIITNIIQNMMFSTLHIYIFKTVRIAVQLTLDYTTLLPTPKFSMKTIWPYWLYPSMPKLLCCKLGTLGIQFTKAVIYIQVHNMYNVQVGNSYVVEVN